MKKLHQKETTSVVSDGPLYRENKIFRNWAGMEGICGLKD